MKVKMTFDKEELEQLIREKAAQGNMTLVSDVNWLLTKEVYDEGKQDIEVSVEVRQMTPEEAMAAGKDLRPVEEKVSAVVESKIRAILDENAHVVGAQLANQLGKMMTELRDSITEDENRNLDDWANIFVHKLDRLGEALALIGKMLPAAPATPSHGQPRAASNGDALPPSNDPPTRPEFVHLDEQGRELSPMEIEAKARMERVRKEQEREAAEYESTKGQRRLTLDGEEDGFPEDLRVK